MKEEENIAEYLQRVDEVTNSIRALGEELKDQPIVQNILRSLPMRYDAKISTLEDRPDLDKLTVDELHGILTTYEMRTGKERPTKGETTFKTSKEKRNQEQMSNEDQSDISDVEEANFIKKLQKGSGKYKGKLPFKCFNCGRIRHFANKCPYPKQEDSDDEEAYNQKDHKRDKDQYKKKFYKKKKNLYSKEDISSSDMSEDDGELLFMGMKNNDVDNNEANYEDEGEVNLEEEFISALEELRKYKKKNKSLREQLSEYEEAQKSREREVSKTIKETGKVINDLKTQLQEAKRIEEVILKQLNDREQDCEKLEAEIVLLKREIEKEKKQSRFENSSKILNDILNNQRSPSNKTGLGYDQKKFNKGSNFTYQEINKNPKSYATTLQSSFRKQESKIRTDLKQQKYVLPSEKNEYRWNTITRKTPPKRHQNIFLGYCFSCNNFGHKAVHCKAYGRYNLRNVQRYKNNKNNTEKRNYNSFSPLQNFNVECQRCNNYDHITNKCRLSTKTNILNYKDKKVWRRKSEVQNKEDEENIAPEIDEVENRRMMGEVSNKECENQSFSYKVDQAQERRIPKREYDTSVVLDDVLQINSSLANEKKMQKEDSKEKNEEVFVTQNNDDDDESSIAYQPEELSDDDLGSLPMLF
jgi:hypothetical protein